MADNGNPYWFDVLDMCPFMFKNPPDNIPPGVDPREYYHNHYGVTPGFDYQKWLDEMNRGVLGNPEKPRVIDGKWKT